MTAKQCKMCNEMKLLSEFGGNNKFGQNFRATELSVYKASCKPCLAKQAKLYRDGKPGLWKKYKNNPNSKNAFFPKEDALLVSAIRCRMANAKRNIKRHPERDFSITDQYMYTLWKEQNGVCKLSGREMTVKRNVHSSLSIDKIIPAHGYIKGNVQWVTTIANRAKSDMTMAELIQLCKDIQETCRDYPVRE